MDPILLTTLSAGEWLESPWLLAIVTRAAHQRGIAKSDLSELLQEVRIALWEQGLSKPITDGWVFRVATFKVIDLLRQRARDRRRHHELPREVLPASRDPEVEHLLGIRVAALAPSLQRFFELHYRQALSEREIARQLGICRASVRWLDRCCRRTLTGIAKPQKPRPSPKI